jgi:amino acid transporter
LSTDVTTATTAETQIPETPDKRGTFGLPTATALVIGSVIGTGVFAVPAALAVYGPISLVAFVLVTIGALALALALALTFWALAGSGYQAVYYGVFCLLLGLPIYIWLKVGRHEYGETAVVPVEAATLATTS